ncbi:Rho termination factor N-terminal domain-containing protein [Nodosilinea sp. LEGE 06152]|uniref:Rho termination factor N-terminal domain-containing protein n=1 Tax=Nodosilinea sp. LEGE 06152 TaxID=2777966 RepID=UPI001880A366|nr:Rho termination factor N-terminal domain-containing protein [Nodosilinea sp. LEGE 06152]MBE9157895.1 Rho termination factor N-terminal domain-containing protein [Nodosilinea sp. LEGE 06152]
MSELPTIAIAAPEAPGGYMLINASEFDREKHQVFDGLIHEPESMGEETAPPGPEPEPKETPALEDLTLTELRSLARERDISGRSAMDKDELIEALR